MTDEVRRMGRESDKAVYSQAQMQIIKDVTALDTTQKLLLNEFKDHKTEDAEHFGKLYKADKEILNEIGKIPERMMQCRDTLKDDIMEEVDKHFVGSTEFKILQTKIITTVATSAAVGSLITAGLTYLVLIQKLTEVAPK